MYYFKVVYVGSDKKKVSVCQNTSIVDSWNRVEYIEKEWVKPIIKNSYLFAFKTLEAAQWFVETHNFGESCEIWKCQAKHPRTPPRNLASYDVSKFWNVIETLCFKKKKLDRWNLPSIIDRYSINVKTPDNTILAKEIKLIEKVQ